jgi:ligand-binding SRPBCC domain-containing protein
MHYLETRQFIPTGIQEAWAFFSNPDNLSRITPPGMGFKIISRSGEAMYPGMIISYKVKPLLGIPLIWVTEITHVKDKSYFVDEQRIGPYRLWHHQHHFKETSGGIEMLDRVDYALPLGFIGRLANSLFVRRKLEQIFRYREQQVREIFQPAGQP